MSIAARDAAVNRFNEDSDCRILLMSLKSGGVALNLTVASHDNCWFFRGLRKANKRGLDIPVLLSLIDICIVQLLAKFCTKRSDICF
ncbi:hypothetical protein MTR67_032388 [Solanum verrucosum]|uniref:Uncharacterized protein n=1 Tax=Solanum verrucosum TaxID=315347 RepID=A0AAF0ZHV3_SOLVR|nr:hypothetical protein MTR67_032388 [Solanum verrucosum]